MDKHRCKPEGYEDDRFEEMYLQNNEEEAAVCYFQSHRHEFDEFKDMKIGDSAKIVVETNGKERCTVTVKAFMDFFAENTSVLVTLR